MRHIDLSPSTNALMESHNQIGLALSALGDFTNGFLHLPQGLSLCIPSNMLRLCRYVIDGSPQHVQFLGRLISSFDGRRSPFSRTATNDGESLRFAEIIIELIDSGRATEISEYDEEIANQLDGAYEQAWYKVELSPKRNFVKDYIAHLMSWSKNSGGLIVERGRRSLSHLGHFISIVQVPDKLAYLTNLKQKMQAMIWKPLGKSKGKYYITITISVLGLVYLPAGIIGVGLAVVDP
ncbi:hypothetical protein [Xanthomonas arboricola]|uniref:hypothetical protein n=1 Tax=Xanthomonas arboricola TaxID=56448 RepID=UPI000F8E4000|nr:hypothetical protein [Xanthomonas arboricola]